MDNLNIFISKENSIKKFIECKIPYFDTEPKIETEKSLEIYSEIMSKLSLHEKLELIMGSLGFVAKNMTLYSQLLCLTQLIPYVMPNYNIMILGEKAAFKSSPYQCYSNIPKIHSGAPTIANLRGDKKLKKVPALLDAEVLCLEEIGDSNLDACLPLLKNAIQQGVYTDREEKETKLNLSLVIVGNVYAELDKNSDLGNPDLIFRGLHNSLKDTAFLERFNAIIFKDNKFCIKKSMLSGSGSKGINVNFLMEAFSNLRKKEYKILDYPISWENPRNYSQILGTVRGILKILYPEQVDIPKNIYEGLYAFATHINSIGRLFINPFPVKSIPFIIEALGFKASMIETITLLDNRILIKNREKKYFLKHAISEWGIVENRKEIDFYKLNIERSDYFSIISKINYAESTDLVVKQEYFPIRSKNNNYNSEGLLIQREDSDFKGNWEFNKLLIRDIKNSIIYNSPFNFCNLREWCEFDELEIKKIVEEKLGFRINKLRKSHYFYNNKEIIKLINFSDYIK